LDFSKCGDPAGTSAAGVILYDAASPPLPLTS
jgi:hypothetical protein